jgi:aconitate hydratase
MGVLPLEFLSGQNAGSLGLTGREVFRVQGVADANRRELDVIAVAEDGKQTSFKARVRIDTPKERDYFKHGGILHYVLRQLAATSHAA